MRLRSRRNLHQLEVMAVTPDDPSMGRTYLNSIGVSIANIKHADLRSLNVPGTPTVLAVDSNGHLTDSWVGTLDGEQEMIILRRVGAVNRK